MSSFFGGLLSYVSESFVPSEVNILSQSPSTYYEQHNLATDTTNKEAGAAFVQTRKLIQKKINTNNRRLAKRATYIADNWPLVEEQVEREKNAILSFSKELKCLPRVLTALGNINSSIQAIVERTEALEELLTGLEVSDLQFKQEKWKKEQNRELQNYHLMLKKNLGERKQKFEQQQSRGIEEMSSLRFQCKQATARSSLYKKKIENVNKEIEMKEAYFESEEYKQILQHREEAVRDQKLKQAFEDAFQKEMEDYRESQVVRPSHGMPDSDITEAEITDLAHHDGLDDFLGPASDQEETEETKVEDDASGPPKIEVLDTEMDPENDPDLL
mmetsp:Transcript_16487/g.22825  ORF Transcript_16487/g.22825 Transcript_16487/m.22825 type:complete len:330 (-) Transcript_16487:39-1028(-)|eukprot:CAMPEP_0201491918 /NCGR_PEP_ID=MMETSP0151_2-20130828/31789_1 /ASSEMBLY_ACC=CAM_ASM_000257 /TAXON_ID=200890 /ORGANISM="Paramoeba atlantica, Strain 621/1 / CCAP 1560/9" /LENGTH=329 /DNA_ID=CAMNT_0047878527 /DNA_START=16 /DNA_END=1005 /DNA_ORIENTATION=-